MSNNKTEQDTVIMTFGRQSDPALREWHTVSQEDARRYSENRTGTTVVTDVNSGRRFEIEHAPCGLGCKCAARIVRRLGKAPKVEVITVRDPDGGTEVYVLVDGVEIEAVAYDIDAGYGHDWEDWKGTRDANLAIASPAAEAILRKCYDNPPGSKYVMDKPDDEPWVPETEA